MEDDNGLELSLGLSCGGSSGKIKGNNNGGSSVIHMAEGGDRSSKVIDDFKNFLHPSSQKQEPSSGSQRSDSCKPPQNFFSDLSKAPTVDVNASTNRFWVEEEAWKETGNKRKFLFPEMNNQKQHGKDALDDLEEKKTKTSHISIATDEGSTAENEDVAESEGGGSSDVVKEVRPSTDANVVDLVASHNKSRGSSVGEEFKISNMNVSVPFTVHPLNVTSSPYSFPAKDSNSNPALNRNNISGHASPSVMQPANFGALPITFGYSPFQLPMLDKDSSWGLTTHFQQLQPHYAGRGTSTAAKGEGKQPAAEGGFSNWAEDAKGGSSTDLRVKDASERLTGDTTLAFDFSAIKPGIAADVKFGGSGARPNLPWVSTTGSGPHGRTISGVTYRYNANQIRIVCACHGLHMLPEEFVRHASEEFVSPEASIGLTAASAHS